MATPKLRFKEFDGDWSAQKYKDALTIKYGKDHKLLDDGEIPVYGTGGVMRYVNQYLYDGESILIGRKGTIDQPKYVNEKFWTVDTLFYSEIKQNIYPLFIYQHALQVNWLGLNEATGVPSLNTTSINNVDIYLPSKEEQTKIASFLSAVDEKISQLTQKHQLLSQYKQGMMQKLFSQQLRFKADDGSEFGEWGNYSLKNLLLKVIDNRGKTPNTSPELEIPLIEINAIGQRNVTYSKVSKFVSKETFKNWFRAYLDDQDILFSTVGNTAICSIYSSQIQAGIAQNIIGLRAKREIIEPVFLYYLLTEDINNKKFKSIEMQAVQPSIKVSQMIHLNFLVPCLEEQTKIANFLSEIDQKIEVVAQQIEQAKQWKKGLLQQMFV